MHKIAVYGSLRIGEYNFKRMELFGEINHISTTTVQGWDLFSLGPYPGIKPGAGTIVVDLLECDDRVYQYIYGMEIGAGYIEREINIDGELYKIYEYTGGTWTEAIPTGDWLKQQVEYV